MCRKKYAERIRCGCRHRCDQVVLWRQVSSSDLYGAPVPSRSWRVGHGEFVAKRTRNGRTRHTESRLCSRRRTKGAPLLLLIGLPDDSIAHQIKAAQRTDGARIHINTLYEVTFEFHPLNSIPIQPRYPCPNSLQAQDRLCISPEIARTRLAGRTLHVCLGPVSYFELLRIFGQPLGL